MAGAGRAAWGALPHDVRVSVFGLLEPPDLAAAGALSRDDRAAAGDVARARSRWYERALLRTGPSGTPVRWEGDGFAIPESAARRERGRPAAALALSPSGERVAVAWRTDAGRVCCARAGSDGALERARPRPSGAARSVGPVDVLVEDDGTVWLCSEGLRGPEARGEWASGDILCGLLHRWAPPPSAAPPSLVGLYARRTRRWALFGPDAPAAAAGGRLDGLLGAFEPAGSRAAWVRGRRDAARARVPAATENETRTAIAAATPLHGLVVTAALGADGGCGDERAHALPPEVPVFAIVHAVPRDDGWLAYAAGTGRFRTLRHPDGLGRELPGPCVCDALVHLGSGVFGDASGSLFRVGEERVERVCEAPAAALEPAQRGRVRWARSRASGAVARLSAEPGCLRLRGWPSVDALVATSARARRLPPSTQSPRSSASRPSEARPRAEPSP